MAPLPLIPNLVTRWCHLNWFQIWSPDGITCISSKFGHQMAPLALVTIATLPWIVLLTLSVSIELVSSSARVTSVKFQQRLSLTQSVSDRDQTHRSDRSRDLGPIKRCYMTISGQRSQMLRWFLSTVGAL